ncbi:amidohydrolase [Psychrobacter sanguinis]|uniref:amidohydrolase n=1 Tax=Psychrobacter sanguinis TaxID=861445 RepID=UPI00191A5E66|nr:amidohydrolase [Psychrobacter sanguinis]MCC3306840.1 amidohydrolase family protein [Psychrobacter sanguinis]UEC26699.1 amidohydrolase family protein [Psychrobacter sanguinis]
MIKKIIPTLVSLSLLAGCSSNTENTVSVEPKVTQVNKAHLYYNGNIIPMNTTEPSTVEALVERKGRIVYVGNLAKAKDQFMDSEQIDLEGRTLLPGFIDAHSHFGMVSNTMGQVDLNPPPVGNISSIDQMLSALKNYKAENNIADGEWIYGWGYDESQLSDKRHPNKRELDKALPNNPVYIQHTSGHMGVANSLALEKMKVSAATKNPEGGMIGRLPNSNEPNGLVQETAMYPFVGHMLQVLNSKQAEFFDQTQDVYAQKGITTAQDGMTDREAIRFFQSQADQGKLKIDLVSLAGFSELESNLKDLDLTFKTYNNGFKVQGTKIIADGSPQGKTAYFTQPYLTKVEGCEKDCTGLPSLSQDTLNDLFKLAYQADNQLFIHANGDASIDMVIKAHEYASKALNQALDKDRRTVVIHSQFVRPDQLETFKKYNIEPSFFTNHAYFWGDVHLENLGKKRAGFLSPIASADKLGLKYTNHSDATVTPIDPLFTMWTAVNRLSRSGKVIGSEEKTSPYQALKSVTSHAAYQLFEEDKKGTLEVGKIADFVILDRNPLTIKPMQIRDIKVVQTIKNGKPVYDATQEVAETAK